MPASREADVQERNTSQVKHATVCHLDRIPLSVASSKVNDMSETTQPILMVLDGYPDGDTLLGLPDILAAIVVVVDNAVKNSCLIKFV